MPPAAPKMASQADAAVQAWLDVLERGATTADRAAATAAHARCCEALRGLPLEQLQLQRRTLDRVCRALESNKVQAGNVLFWAVRRGSPSAALAAAHKPVLQ